MKSFIKDNGSLVKQNDNKVKVYHSLADAETALANGEIAEGEVITTEFVDGAADIAETNNLISDAIALLNDRVDQLEGGESGLNDKISSSATSTNKCPSMNEVYALMDVIEPIGTIKLAYITSGWDTAHWALCDGTNGTPDMRECVPVGVGQNTTQSSISAHDEYTLGQFKDDQFQEHGHSIDDPGHTHNVTALRGRRTDSWEGENWTASDWSIGGVAYLTDYAQLHKTGITVSGPAKNGDDGDIPRVGSTTHGKQIGLNFIMKIANYHI